MMNMKNVIGCGVLASVACVASAETLPQVVGDMRHVMIGLSGGMLEAHVEDAGTAAEMWSFPGEAYDGAAGVLDEMYYSSQYGWLADGFISLGTGESIMIENVSSTPGLEAYEGGMRMMRANHTYDAIFGTDGSAMATPWDGMMRHDWFAAESIGDYQATFRLYVADAAGGEVTSYGDTEVTLLFSAVPAPGGLAVLGLGGLVAGRRRRA